MGIYDFVVLNEKFTIPDYNENYRKSDVSWQTRSFPDVAYRIHYITGDGKLFRAHHEYESTGLTDNGFQDEINSIGDEELTIQNSDLDWYRVRYNGTLRVISQAKKCCML